MSKDFPKYINAILGSIILYAWGFFFAPAPWWVEILSLIIWVLFAIVLIGMCKKDKANNGLWFVYLVLFAGIFGYVATVSADFGAVLAVLVSNVFLVFAGVVYVNRQIEKAKEAAAPSNTPTA